MTQEKKELLLKDLCVRLPYGVKCKWEHKYDGKTYTGGGVLCDIDHVKTSNGYRYWDCYFEDEGDDIPLELVKPYLRPMSSMTEEEANELDAISDGRLIDGGEYLGVLSQHYWTDSFKYILLGINWLNAHHFDYRGLIEKGLALEAPEGMYKTWNSLRGNLKEDNQGNIVGGLKL